MDKDNTQKNRREQVIRDAKCGLILTAARNAFAQKGFQETRLEDIAQIAGFSKASLYNYFQDKEEIFLSLAIQEYGIAITEIKSACDSKVNLVCKLDALLRTLFTHFGHHFSLMLSMVDFNTSMNFQLDLCKHKDLSSRMKGAVKEISDIVVESFEIAKKKKEIGTTIDSAILSQYLGSMIHGTLMEWKNAGKMDDIEKRVKNLIEFICQGLEYNKKNASKV